MAQSTTVSPQAFRCVEVFCCLHVLTFLSSFGILWVPRCQAALEEVGPKTLGEGWTQHVGQAERDEREALKQANVTVEKLQKWLEAADSRCNTPSFTHIQNIRIH